jgi:hypothetical protein
MPIQLKLKYENGNDTIVTVWNDKQTQNFSFVLNEEVSSIEFDPDKWILRQQQYNPDLPVGIVDFEVEKSINIYPNPFTDYLVIDINQMFINSTFEFTIYNISGRLIDQSYINLSSHKVIKTSDYSSGLYYIHLKETGKNGIWKKLIKY